MTAVVNNTPAIAPSNKPTIICSIKKAFKTAYYIMAADFIVLTIIVGNLLKGSQGVGIFSTTSIEIKQTLSAISAAGAAFESIQASVKAATIFMDRSNLFEHVKKPNPTQPLGPRVEDLTAACTHIKENGKTLRKSLNVDKSVKLSERANQVLEGIASEDKKVQIEALEKGEEFVKTIRRRANTQLGFALANVVTRIGAFAIAIVLAVTAANPVTLIITGVIGLGILAVVIGQKIMLPSNPFDEPDKESKLQMAAFKIRNTVYKAVDRLEAIFNKPRPVAA